MRLIIYLVRSRGGKAILLPSGTLGDGLYIDYYNISGSTNKTLITNNHIESFTLKIKRKIKELGFIRFIIFLFIRFFRP